MRSKKRSNWVKLALAIGCLTGLVSISALAATNSISLVTVRVGAEATASKEVNEWINYNIWDSIESQVGTYAATESTKYSIRLAEWVVPDERHLYIGNEPEMRIFLHMDADDYRFSSGLNHRGVTVMGGTLVSAVINNQELELVVKLDGIKGQFAEPDAARWSGEGYGSGLVNGNAAWTFANERGSMSSGAYDVILYRGGATIKRIDAYRGESYDFYPYMTKPGTYSYKVRTVPTTEAEKNTGKKSEWVESGDVVITETNVSDGAGQGDWILDAGNWYFQFPNQTRNKSPWYMINTTWFLFDAEGKLMTGWQVRDGQTYYIDEYDGMLKGWQEIAETWYYFYPDSGKMAVNTTVDGYVIDGNGVWS